MVEYELVDGRGFGGVFLLTGGLLEAVLTIHWVLQTGTNGTEVSLDWLHYFINRRLRTNTSGLIEGLFDANHILTSALILREYRAGLEIDDLDLLRKMKKSQVM